MASKQGLNGLRPKLISIAVASCFVTSAAFANPTGPTVVHGTAAIQGLGTNLVQVTNSPSAIINWQSFSIGANEITRFIQQSQSSAVLNRVTGADPSVILGALQSNGRVFLINPSGILFGAGAQIDVAGLVASSLSLSDQDFLANRLKFTVPGAGSVVNQGSITTPSGGHVYLVGSTVTNNGIITSPRGEVVLAAGQSVELVNPGTPNLRVEITALDNQAINLGTIVADSGRVGIYAGLINQSGTIRADGAVAEGGRIVLKATKNATLEAGSFTTANGATGGGVTVRSGDTTLVAGTVEAKGPEGAGGTIHLLGDKVGVYGNAAVDASGNTGGGTVLVGGDFQGKNADVQNASATFFGSDATIKADAVQNGDGGKVIVWADEVTRAYGTISARGGAEAGNGGFVEVSGKGWLDFNASVDTRAPNGKTGTLLLDPTNIIISSNQSLDYDTSISNSGSEGLFEASGPVTSSQLFVSALEGRLATNNVTVSTANTDPFAYGSGIIHVQSPVSWSSNNSLTLLAHSEIYVEAAAAITNTGSGNISLYAGWDGVSTTTPVVNTFGGSINLNAPITTLGNVVLVGGHSIFQSSSAPVTANRLLAMADGGEGSVNMNSTTNRVNFLAGRASAGDFRFQNGQSLTVDSVGGVNGITTSDGVVLLDVTAGNLTVVQAINATVTSGAAGVWLKSLGNVTINSAVTANGGNNSFGAGGNAVIDIESSGGSVSIGAVVTATGGASFGGGGGGGTANIVAAGTDVNLLASGSLKSTGGGGAPVGAADVEITSAGNVTLGGNITTIGENAFIDDGIFISAGNAIISAAGGILDARRAAGASNFPHVTLSAVNGIGTQAAPVRILDGSEATGPDLNFRNTGTSGDISVRFETGDIQIDHDVFGTFNANPTGTYFLTVQNGDFALNAPFRPSMAFDGTNATDLNGQSILVATPNGNITLGQTGAIATTTGNISLTANGSIALMDNSVIQSSQGGTVALISGTTITESQSARISTTGNLLAQSSGNQALTGLNAVAFLTSTTNGGSLSFVNEGNVDVLSALTSGGAVNMTVNPGTLTISGQINAGAGAVNLAVPAGTVFGTGTSPDIVGGTLAVSAGVNIDGDGGLQTDVPNIVSLFAPNGLINVSSTLGGVTVHGAQAGSSLTLSANGPLTIVPLSGNATVSSGGSMSLSATDINLGSASQTADMDIVAGNGMTLNAGKLTVLGGNGGHTFVRTSTGNMAITTTGDVIVTGGSSGGFAHVLGSPDLTMSVGGTVQMNAIDATAPARIESAIPATVYVDFTTGSSGGYFVNGQEGVTADPALGTGFYADGAPAVLGQNLITTYGGVPPSTSVPGVEQAVNQVISSINDPAKVPETQTSSGDPAGDGEEKKELPVCS